MRVFSLGIFLFFSLRVSAECLVTFNVYGPIYAGSVTSRTREIVREVKSQHPCKLVHLQEAWNDSQIDIIDNGLNSDFQIYSPNREFKIGLMALTRQAWSEAHTYSFNVNYDSGFLDRFRRWVRAQKAFAILKNVLPNTQSVNTHLHPSSSPIRIMQIMDLFKWRVTVKDQALVLTGDFNSEPASLEHRLVQAVLDVDDAYLAAHGSYPADFCTYCEDNPLSWLRGNHVFDYIYFSRPRVSREGWKAKGVQRVLTGTQRPLSDHYGIKAQFEKAIYDTSVPPSSRQEILNVLIEAETELLVSDHEQAPEYLQLLRQIESEIISGVGVYADYFAEIIH